MIPFFRKLRKKLADENQFVKYSRYAVGEILLVVIGILIALGINNWNQERLSDKRELDLLQNLKEELDLNVLPLKEMGSAYDVCVKECKEGMELLKHPLNLATFLEINSLIRTIWTNIEVYGSTYDEMLNSGSFYSLNNKILQENIRLHYSMADKYIKTFDNINESGMELGMNNESLIGIPLLVDWSAEENNNLKEIETSWINNPNSPIFQAYYKRAKFFTNTNAQRKNTIERFVKSCETLSDKIEIELMNEDKK